MSNDPTLLAARENIGESLEEIRKAVAGLTADQLNARPAGGDSNPLGVIATHALAGTRSWLALATGAPLPPRDRPAEFRAVVDDGDAFRSQVDAQIAAILALLDDAGSFDPSRADVAPWMSGPRGSEPVTAAWALQHGLAHLGEHVGHAHLTRQLLET